jgi:hypothetical protein
MSRGPSAELAAGLEIRQGPLPYILSLPTTPSRADARHPLLVFLHGRDEGAPTDIAAALTRHGPLAPTAHPAARGVFAIAAPQLPVQGDRWLDHAEQVRAVVAEVVRESPIDPDALVLCGFSFGGNGVLDLGLHQPDLWSALWAVDPTRVPAATPGQPVWLSGGSLARPLVGDFLRRLVLVRAEAADASDRVWEDAGSDHAGTARIAFASPRPYAWLRARSGGS